MNEQFRTTFRGGQILLTASVAELPDMVKEASAFEKVATLAITETTDFGADAHLSGVVLKEVDGGIRWSIVWTNTGLKFCIQLVTLNEPTCADKLKTTETTIH